WRGWAAPTGKGRAGGGDPPPRHDCPRQSSFVRMGRIAFQAIDHTGLRCSERDPVPGGLLKGEEERLGPLHGLVVQFIPPLELDLERELSDQGIMVTPIPP